MDPFTWIAIITAVISAAGAATSYVGQQSAAKAAEDTGRQQQAAADASARNQEAQTNEAILRERTNNRRRLARMHADMAGTSGLTMGGSSMDVFAETSGNMELQVQDAARAGSMAAANTRMQGDMALWQGRTSATATRIGSYGSLLTSGAALAPKVKTAWDSMS